MKIDSEIMELKLRKTFKLSSGATDTRRNVLLRLGEGLGEAPLPPSYSETVESVQRYFARIQTLLPQDLATLKDVIQVLALLPAGDPSARCALDVAMHDHVAKKLKIPLYQLLNLSEPKILETSFTIAMAEPDEMAESARHSKLPILKIKVGGSRDLEIVKAVREATSARLRLDANGGWTREQALHLIPRLSEHDLELIEQPLAKEDLEGMRWLKKQLGHKAPPLYADESVQNKEDLLKLQGLFEGIVVKIMKCGGLQESLALLQQAKAQGFKIMLSCMVETSLGVGAAYHLASLADHFDLDGPWLISNDPFEGFSYEGAKIILAKKAGVGVSFSSSHPD